MRQFNFFYDYYPLILKPKSKEQAKEELNIRFGGASERSRRYNEIEQLKKEMTLMKLQKYRVHWTKGTYNCATHQLATLTIREYMDIEAANKQDAVNTVFEELAEEMEWIGFHLTVDKNAPTYRGWEAYGRPSDKFRLDHGMAMSAERIYVFDDFLVKVRKEAEQ